jgi:hypothetical protein
LSLHPKRLEFVFTPKHGSWLNIVETLFSKQELIDRIHLNFQQINSDPVIFRWKYQMDEITIV